MRVSFRTGRHQRLVARLVRKFDTLVSRIGAHPFNRCCNGRCTRLEMTPLSAYRGLGKLAGTWRLWSVLPLLCARGFGLPWPLYSNQERPKLLCTRFLSLLRPLASKSPLKLLRQYVYRNILHNFYCSVTLRQRFSVPNKTVTHCPSFGHSSH